MTDLRTTEKEVPAEVVCAAMAAKCHCDLDAADDHETHECDCGGQWTGTNPEYHVVRFPDLSAEVILGSMGW